MKQSFLIFTLIFISHLVFSQIEKEKIMHRIISTPTGDELAPYMTPDGNTLIFMKKTVSSKEYHIHITTKKKGQWSRPIEIPTINKHSSMLMLGGYCISPDGSQIIYSTKKHPSIGGYDLWMSQKEGDWWGEPTNIGAPINTKANEGMPSFSADGKSLFFIRGHLHHHRLSGNVYVATQRKNSWSTPKLVTTPKHISQLQQSASGSHFLINNTKGVHYYNIKTKTLSNTIINDPYVFFTTNYKHNTINYSKDVNKMFDIYKGIINVNENTPAPTLQYKVKSNEPQIISFYDSNTKVRKKIRLKAKTIKTFYIDSTVQVSLQNKDLYYATETISFNKSKTQYCKLKPTKQSIQIDNNKALLLSALDKHLFIKYLKTKKTTTLKVSYSCPQKITLDTANLSNIVTQDLMNNCEQAIKNNIFWNEFSDFTLHFEKTTTISDKPKWVIQF